MLFDAHCHLQDDRLLPSVADVISRARLAGVLRMACCGSSEDDWEAVRDLARANPDCVVPSFGLHPWYVSGRSSNWLSNLRKMLISIPSGVGEIGLDHALEDRNDAEQEEVFKSQVFLAREMDRPVSIHCRRAWGRLVELLDDLQPLPRCLIHSFSGSPDMVAQLSKWNVWFSFSGSITHERNVRGRRSAERAPNDRLLIETDAPDIMPALPGESGEVNEPANLGVVVDSVAAIRHAARDDIAALTWNNAVVLFGDLRMQEQQ